MIDLCALFDMTSADCSCVQEQYFASSSMAPVIVSKAESLCWVHALGHTAHSRLCLHSWWILCTVLTRWRQRPAKDCQLRFSASFFLIFTARCYAEDDIVTPSRPYVCLLR